MGLLVLPTGFATPEPAQGKTLEGKLLIGHGDDLKRGRSRDFYTLEVQRRSRSRKSDNTRLYSLVFRGRRAKRFLKRIRSRRSHPSSYFIRARGRRSGRRLIVRRSHRLRHARQSTPARARAAGVATGPKKVAVMKTNFIDDPTEHPWNEAAIRQALFTGANSVNEYLKEVSQGELSLGGRDRIDGDFYGYYTIDATRGCGIRIGSGINAPGNSATWADLADQQAEADGADLSGYDYVVYLIPQVNCGVSGWVLALGDRRVFVTGAQNAVAPIFTHEFGHALGAAHANAWRCENGDGQLAPIGANCENHEYGDPFDVMGQWPAQRHFNDYHKEDLGFLTGTVQTATSEGLYTLVPSEPATAPGAQPFNGIQGLRIPRDTRDRDGYAYDSYDFEYRQPYGVFDDFSLGDPVTQGVSIRVVPPQSNLPALVKPPHLIDTTPGDGFSIPGGPPQNNYANAALPLGQTFNDPRRNISITTLSTSPTGTQVWLAHSPPMGITEQVVVDGSNLMVNSGSGRANKITISRSDSTFTIKDASITSTSLVVDAPGCNRTSASTVRCTDSSISKVLVNTGDLDDEVTISAAVDSEVDGGTGADTLLGSNDVGSKDTLIGGEGDDVLEGRGGDDLLAGRAGNDTASYESAASGVDVTLATARAQDTKGAGNDQLFDMEKLVGSSHDDTLGDKDNGAVPGSNDNLLDGRGGNDTAFFARWNVTVDLSITGPQTTGRGMDTLANIENLRAYKGHNTLRGNSAANVIEGGNGDDTIEGRGGNDTLIGGPGTDTVSYESSSSEVTVILNNRVSGGAGSDTISGFENLTGSSHDDVLHGDEGSNIIYGRAGADTIYGGGGQSIDIIFGGPGSEISMNGGDGLDVVVDLAGGSDHFYNSGGQALFLDLGPLSESDTFSGLGSETVYYSARSQGVNVSLDGIANDGANCPGPDFDPPPDCEKDNVGTAFASSTIENVVGGAGADTFSGSPVKANVFYGAGGRDTVDYSDSPEGVEVRPDGKPNDGMQGEGDNVASDIENITGSPKADTLIGSEVGNVLRGLAGADKLYGLGGNDTYYAGQDTQQDLLSERYFYFTGDGSDVFKMRDVPGARDRLVTCGPGTGDFVEADGEDTIDDSASCELIEVATP